MFKRSLVTLAALSLAAFTFGGTAGCSGGTTGTGGGAGGGAGGGTGGGSSDPDLVCETGTPTVTFTTVYTDVFPNCNTCHLTTSVDGSASYGLYDTQAHAFEQVGKVSLYAGTPKTLKVVDPNKPGNSTMWLKVIGHSKSPDGKNVGASMPNGSAQISAALKKTLKDWICSGAGM
jgi:hypothetical protein